MGLEYRFKSSEKFPAYALITGSVAKVFSDVVVSAGISAKKQDDARPNFGSRLDAYWTQAVNLGVSKKIDDKRGLSLVLSQEWQKTNEALDSGYGSVNVRVKTSTATLGYYQAF